MTQISASVANLGLKYVHILSRKVVSVSYPMVEMPRGVATFSY